MKASCYFRAPTTGEHFTSGFTSGLLLRYNQCCQLWDFIPRSWDFLRLLGFYWLFFFRNKILGFLHIYRLGLCLANIDWIQVFADAWDLLIDLLYLLAKSSPVFFSENGTPWGFLRKKWESWDFLLSRLGFLPKATWQLWLQ